jgi:hypothetical protein
LNEAGFVNLRFHRRVSLLPGVRLNVGTRGVSASFGHRGAWYTVGPHGRRTATLGWPGTGLRYTATSGGGRRRQGVPPASSAWVNLAWIVAISVFWVWVFTRG